MNYECRTKDALQNINHQFIILNSELKEWKYIIIPM